MLLFIRKNYLQRYLMQTTDGLGTYSLVTGSCELCATG